ncbi:hypothetical protein Tco_0557202, partial [Tanacetum coccineum]
VKVQSGGSDVKQQIHVDLDSHVSYSRVDVHDRRLRWWWVMVEGGLESRRDIQDVLKQRVQRLRRDGVFDGAFGGVGDEEVVVGEGVVVTSSSLEMLTNSCLEGIMVNLIFLKGFEEEALVEFMVDFG